MLLWTSTCVIKIVSSSLYMSPCLLLVAEKFEDDVTQAAMVFRKLFYGGYGDNF